MAETAGIILGSLPLIIAALEHYEDVARSTEEFFGWRKYRRRLRSELYILRTSFDEGVKILLQGIAGPDELIAMIDDPASDLWITGSIADELRDALGPTYDPFILTIVEIDEILLSIMKHLNIEGAGLASGGLRDIVLANRHVAESARLKRNFEFTKQVAFTMKKKGIKASLKRVEDCVGRIDDWTKKAKTGQGNNTVHHHKIEFADLTVIKTNATRLYRTLSRSWCKNRAQHSTFLLLEQRFQRRRRPRRARQSSTATSKTDATCFSLSIRGDCFPQLPHFNTEIRIVQTLIQPPATMPTTLPTTMPTPTSIASTKVRRVGFNTAVVQQPASESPYSNPSNLPLVAEFCAYVRCPVHAYPGFCLDDQENLRAYSSENPKNQYVSNFTTLASLLPRLQEKLPLEEIYGLAITLVASIFQLSHTPWLEKEWSKKSIAFLRASEDPPPIVDIKYPYLIQIFPQESQVPKGHTSDGSKFLSLAIMLLEINFGKPIEHMREPGNERQDTETDEFADLPTANRWFQAKNSRLTAGFQKAILTSLQETLNPKADLRNSDYCEAIKDKLLQPLEKEMRDLVA